MIRAEHIVKSFDGRVVLDDISIEFETAKTNLIIGRSGSGKTVLLKTLVGLHEPDSGDVWYDDVNFTALGFRERKAIRKDIGMIFQGGALLDSSTVEENVKLPLDLFTTQSEAEKMERVNFCLQRVRLEDANRLYPAELSGGMIKRVAIARAIVLNPRYLFCDEPNSGLDPQTSIVIDNLIHEITQEYNITTIVNTHDMNSVMEIGEKIVYIHDGRKWWEGTKESILHAENRELNDFQVVGGDQGEHPPRREPRAERLCLRLGDGQARQGDQMTESRRSSCSVQARSADSWRVSSGSLRFNTTMARGSNANTSSKGLYLVLRMKPLFSAQISTSQSAYFCP